MKINLTFLLRISTDEFIVVLMEGKTMTFSIFNAGGENIEGKLFDSLPAAQIFLETNDYSEFGENLHAGQNCYYHDEGEAGHCPFCCADFLRDA